MPVKGRRSLPMMSRAPKRVESLLRGRVAVLATWRAATLSSAATRSRAVGVMSSDPTTTMVRGDGSTTDVTDNNGCWGLVLKCFELRTRQHRMLNVKSLRPLKHYFPEDLMSFGRRLWVINHEGLTFVIRSKIMRNEI
jgi:hypothetical protein